MCGVALDGFPERWQWRASVAKAKAMQVLVQTDPTISPNTGSLDTIRYHSDTTANAILCNTRQAAEEESA